MTGPRWKRLVRFALCALFAHCLSACGSPLVGLECASGYSQCGSTCRDLQSDPRHCGGCDVRCSTDQICQAGACTEAGDAGGDGAVNDAGDFGDAGPGDGGLGDGGDGSMLSDGGGSDVELPPLCTGPTSPDDCVCELGQLSCDKTCVDADRDPGHCGACDRRCADEALCSGAVCYCVAGECVRACEGDLTLCGPGNCVDLQTDPDNCGQCGRGCSSGLCVAGECLGRTVGHVIVIGHDLSNSRAGMRRLAGNAIFLPNANPLRILYYAERATPAAGAGVLRAIEEMSAATGRAYGFSPGGLALPPEISPLTLPFVLNQVDVLVIASQGMASDEMLIENGQIWSRALVSFVQRGGVVVLFDGGGAHSGTYQILEQAGLFAANGRTSLTTPNLELSAPGDAVAGFVPVLYQGERETVGFSTSEETIVVRDPDTMLPVVVHIAR